MTRPEPDLARQHSNRFRQVSNRYPRRVAEAYDGDLARAMADTDAQVARTVAAWEQAHGMAPRNWRAIGREERDEAAGWEAHLDTILDPEQEER